VRGREREREREIERKRERERKKTFKAHRLLYHSTLGFRVIKKRRRREKEKVRGRGETEDGGAPLAVLGRVLSDLFVCHVHLQRESSLLKTYWSKSTLSS